MNDSEKYFGLVIGQHVLLLLLAAMLLHVMVKPERDVT